MQKKKYKAEEIHSVTNKGSLFEEMIWSRRNAMQKKSTMLPIKDRYLKKKCNVAEIHSVTNKGSLFEEQMKYSRRNPLLLIRGHHLKKKCNAEEIQC